jgi:hypothetical protein
MIERPLLINAAPTGAVSDFSKNPNVPITVDAIVADIDWACRPVRRSRISIFEMTTARQAAIQTSMATC